MKKKNWEAPKIVSLTNKETESAIIHSFSSEGGHVTGSIIHGSHS